MKIKKPLDKKPLKNKDKEPKKKKGLFFKTKEEREQEKRLEVKNQRSKLGTKGSKVNTASSLKFKGNVDKKNIKDMPKSNLSLKNGDVPNSESTLGSRTSRNKPSAKAKLIRESWGYEKFEDKKKLTSEPWENVEVEENERVISRRVVMESVNDITGLTFLEKLKLVTFYKAKSSGKLDEQRAQEEYNRNYERLKMENGLKNTLLMMAKNNLEVAEHETIVISIDPKFKDVIDTCIKSRALSSYEITYLRREDILVNQGKDVIVISMKLKKIM